MAFLDKFAESSYFFAGSLESRDSLLECMIQGDLVLVLVQGDLVLVLVQGDLVL